MAEKKHPVQSIDRVFDILEVLSSIPQGMALSDISEAVGLHVSTTHRLLAALTSRGYVRKDAGTGKYRLTLRLFEISQRVSTVLDLLPVSEHYLEELANLSGEAVHLVERSGSEVVYLYKFEPYSNPVNISSSVGRHNPMYCTGVGKSILACLPEDEVKAVWDATDVQKFTEKTLTTLGALQADLGKTRERGYAIDDEEHDPNVRCVAAPIFNWKDEPVAAISISAPSSRFTEETIQKLAPKVIAAAKEISGLLGKVPEEKAEPAAR
ncbi:MAG: IclR family transcriptional regulator [Firmicutes bacterium]|nr:IclR family transcriptional regulator [Bacillota bacterium]